MNKKYFNNYYIKNKTKILERGKLYQIKNKKKISKYQKEYRKKHNKSSSTMFLIGCDNDYLMYHLQCQFKEGMSWDNYGGIGK